MPIPATKSQADIIQNFQLNSGPLFNARNPIHLAPFSIFPTTLAIRRQHVRLIDQDQIEGVQVGGAAVDALNASDDDRMLGVAASQTRRVHPDAVPQVRGHRVQLFDGLFEQFLDVREDQHTPVPLAYGITADRRHHRRLAPGRRNDDAGVVIPTAQVFVDGRDGLGLVRSQRNRRFRQPLRGWKKRLAQASTSTSNRSVRISVVMVARFRPPAVARTASSAAEAASRSAPRSDR